MALVDFGGVKRPNEAHLFHATAIVVFINSIGMRAIGSKLPVFPVF